MCLIVFAYKVHPDYKFILTANRDEFYERPTSAANWWEDQSDILGGRDLKAGGTWMAVNKNGRFAALTNYRDIQNIRNDARSRGDLPTDFLARHMSAKGYAKTVVETGAEYNGFNLLVMDHNALCHVSNYENKVNELEPGIYGLSNALLDTPWPKVQKAKADFEDLIKGDFGPDDLLQVMTDEATAPDSDLPQTGLPLEMEKALSAMCIRTHNYGTCCTTAMTMGYDGKVAYQEKSYPVGNRHDEVVRFKFTV